MKRTFNRLKELAINQSRD